MADPGFRLTSGALSGVACTGSLESFCNSARIRRTTREPGLRPSRPLLLRRVYVVARKPVRVGAARLRRGYHDLYIKSGSFFMAPPMAALSIPACPDPDGMLQLPAAGLCPFPACLDGRQLGSCVVAGPAAACVQRDARCEITKHVSSGAPVASRTSSDIATQVAQNVEMTSK